MKLDVSCMRYLTKDDYRVLTAIEMGMRNHEMVPVPLITSIAKLRHGGSYKILSVLLRYKLIAHTNTDYNGYRLSYMGYDILALRSLLARGTITSVGSQIGVGKESDIFEATNEHGEEIVIKIHRLGRTSFRAVRNSRDYMQGKHKASWLYMSRLAAMKEYSFMRALFAHGFPTPVPIDQSRHIVAMSKVLGSPMCQIKTGNMYGAEAVFSICSDILTKLAQHGLIHCDFNEFNLMLDEHGHVTLIDFPQMVSTAHANAKDLFNRDVDGLVKFFAMKMRYSPPNDMIPRLDNIVRGEVHIDEEVRASGFAQADDELLLEFMSNSVVEEDCGEGNVDEEVIGKDAVSEQDVIMRRMFREPTGILGGIGAGSVEQLRASTYFEGGTGVDPSMFSVFRGIGRIDDVDDDDSISLDSSEPGSESLDGDAAQRKDSSDVGPAEVVRALTEIEAPSELDVRQKLRRFAHRLLTFIHSSVT